MLKALACALLCFVSVSLGQVTFPAGIQDIKNAAKDSGMRLYYEFYDDNSTLRMGLDIASTVDYFAIGFAPRGTTSQMANFDIVAFVVVPDAQTGERTVTIMDLFATGYAQPPTDESLGGTSDYNLIEYYATADRTQVVFDRLWDTSDRFDYVFDKDSAISDGIALNWAWLNSGEHALDYHGGNAGVIEFKMDDSNASPLTFTDWAYYIHKFGLLFCWIILLEIAVQYGRYNKHTKHALNIHRILTGIITVFTIVSSLLLVYLSGIDYTLTTGFAHFIIGVIIMSTLTFQALFGAILGILITSLGVSRRIPSFGKFHWIAGIFLDVLAKAEAALGLYIWQGFELMASLLVLYAIIVGFRIMQEIKLYQNRTITEQNIKELEKADSEHPRHRKLMELLNRNVPVSVILETAELKGMKWAMLDNKVFEFKNFNHPGGNFMMDKIIGREVGRFLYGAYGLEIPEGTKQHSHSILALRVIQDNFIGTIRRTHDILITDDRTVKAIIDPSSSFDTSLVHSEGLTHKLLTPVQMNRRWTLVNKIPITSQISRFEFSCQGHYVNTGLYDIRSLGRHLKISHGSHSKTRLYTLVFSQTEERVERRAALKGLTSETPTSKLPANKTHGNSLPLVIKQYPGLPDAFSTFVHNSSVDTNGFLIEGPFGPGFGLTTETTGLHYIFAAGTGMLPFLDLFDFLLEGLVAPSSATNLFSRGFRLHVFASFAQIGDFVGLDICQQLVDACKAKGIPDAFKLTIKVMGSIQPTEHYSVTSEDFTDAFLSKNVDVNKCERAFVCGPPKVNAFVPSGLVKAGVSRTKIEVV